MQQRPSLSLAKLVVAAVGGVALALVISTANRQWQRHQAEAQLSEASLPNLQTSDLQAWPVAADQMASDLAPPDYVRPYGSAPEVAVQNETPGKSIANRLFGTESSGTVMPPYRLPPTEADGPVATADVEEDLAQNLYYPPTTDEGPQMIVNSLIDKPAIEELPAPELVVEALPEELLVETAEIAANAEPLVAKSLKAQPLEVEPLEVITAVPKTDPSNANSNKIVSQPTPATLLAEELLEEELLVESLEDPDAALARQTPTDSLMADMPAVAEIEKLVTPELHAAYGLGRSGALYRAREEFVAVLQKIALARDTAQTTDRHTVSLKAGLRAIEEADDFVPLSATLDQPLTVAEVAASHRTPLLHDADSLRRWSLPHEAVALYHRYAQRKLAGATGGSQAGSMALHGLGKTFARLAVLQEDEHADRLSRTMYRAALLTRADNYLAANELGVSLASVGRSKQARLALEQAVSHGGNSTVFRNLANVQRKLGQGQLAQAAQQRADQLASAEMSRGMFSAQRGVQWVSPAEFNQTGRNAGPSTSVAAAGQPPQQRPTSAPQVASRPQNLQASPKKSWWNGAMNRLGSSPQPTAGRQANGNGPNPRQPQFRPVTRVPGTQVPPPAGRTRLGQAPAYAPSPNRQQPDYQPPPPARSQRVLR